MIQLDQHEGSYLSICKHYRAIYDTPCIQAESEKWQQVKKHGTQNICIFMGKHPFHYQINSQQVKELINLLFFFLMTILTNGLVENRCHKVDCFQMNIYN